MLTRPVSRRRGTATGRGKTRRLPLGWSGSGREAGRRRQGAESHHVVTAPCHTQGVSAVAMSSVPPHLVQGYLLTGGTERVGRGEGCRRRDGSTRCPHEVCEIGTPLARTGARRRIPRNAMIALTTSLRSSLRALNRSSCSTASYPDAVPKTGLSLPRRINDPEPAARVARDPLRSSRDYVNLVLYMNNRHHFVETAGRCRKLDPGSSALRSPGAPRSAGVPGDGLRPRPLPPLRGSERHRSRGALLPYHRRSVRPSRTCCGGSPGGSRLTSSTGLCAWSRPGDLPLSYHRSMSDSPAVLHLPALDPLMLVVRR